MNLCFSARFLVAGLLLTSSALTDEGCEPLTAPQAPDNPAMMLVKFHFIMGYTDNDFFNSILKKTNSSWIRFSKVPGDPGSFNMFESNNIDGKCFTANLTVTMDGIRATASLDNFNSDYYLLPSCPGCLVLTINSTVRNVHQLLKLMKMDLEAGPSEITARSLYLMANRTSLPESELERFKKQAGCLGFSREPDYQYDAHKVFCREGEGVHVVL